MLDRKKLKSREEVELGVVKGPDDGWAPRLEGLLAHKGDFWRWGNEQVLRHDCGIDAFYYILHRDGNPFANIMTVEYQGVGILGHVYTKPEDRRQRAASSLMGALTEHFRDRGGRALFLGTGYDSPAYRIYHRFGFRSVEPKSGNMAYFVKGQEAFGADYFSASDSEVKPLEWRHWPASPPLFLGGWPGVVRCLPLRLTGRRSTEGPALKRLKAEAEARDAGLPCRTTAALISTRTGAVVGLAASGPDPLWPHTLLVDVYCHPDFWNKAGNLLQYLEPGLTGRCIAYSDASCPAKADLLAQAGFRRIGGIRDHIAADLCRTSLLDIDIWQRS